MFGEFFKSIGESLIPIKRMDANALSMAIKNPIKYRKLILDSKQAILIYLDPEEIKIIGGIEFANTVFNPEIGKGWIISEEATKRMEKRRTYICHPKIPHALIVDTKAFNAQSKVSKETKTTMGLPENWIQLQTDTLANIAISKWNASFDERPGNAMIFLFGVAAGLATGILIIMLLFIVLGALS